MNYLIRGIENNIEYSYPVRGKRIYFEGYTPVEFFITRWHTCDSYNISEAHTGFAIVHFSEFISDRKKAIQKAKERLDKHGLSEVLQKIAETTPVSGIKRFQQIEYFN